MTQRIGGERVRVSFPAPPGEDPAWWMPDPETVADFQRADLIVLNGAGYARWVGLVSLPRARLVDTSVAFQEKLIPLEDTVTHGHGPEGEHSHQGMAFTTWLDPSLAIEQARAIDEALAGLQPDRAASFSANREALESDLLEIDARLDAAARSLDGAPLLFSHPVYQYLIRRYQLNAISLHWEPDQHPGEAEWRGLRDLLQEHPARWMIWEAPPVQETVRRLAELGVATLVFDPAAGPVESRGFLQVMRANAAALEGAGASHGDPAGDASGAAEPESVPAR
jgi:zinc transport system substrate-binding protein